MSAEKGMGCHKTKKEAEDQIAAIYANEGGKMTAPHTHAAKVRLVRGASLEHLHQLVRERSPELNDEEELFFWEAEISNDLIDSHFTHMSEETLRNYAADAEAGVAFLKGHDWRSLPLGYSLSGQFEQADGRKRVIAGFYTVRGLEDTDALIRRMEARIVRDVSVGFHGGTTTCDICGRDVWDWDCRHIPGLTYEEKKDGQTTSVLATFTIDKARLSEVSGVFDGSTPEAMIRKASGIAKAGELTREQVHLLEDRYRVALPYSATYAGVAINNRSKEMNEEEVAKIRSVLGLGGDGDVVGGIEKLNQALDEANKRINTLEPQAKDGVQYRSDLVAEALAEGVRAQGKEFDSELYENMLKDAPIPVIKRMRDDWKKVADAVLPAGRQSVEGDEEAKVKTVASVPDSAYA